MESLILLCIFISGYLIAFKPEKQKMAFSFLCLSLGISIFCWIMGTWSQIIPAGNL